MDKPRWVKSTAFDGDEKKELRCPKCACPYLVFDTESETGFMDLGKEASCWECGYVFTITENCWKLKNECD
jgi:hypothetical protein